MTESGSQSSGRQQPGAAVSDATEANSRAAASAQATDGFFRPSSLAATAEKLASTAGASSTASAAPAASPFRLCPPSLPLSGVSIGGSNDGNSGACNGGTGGGAAGPSGESASSAVSSSSSTAAAPQAGGNYFSRFVQPLTDGGGGGSFSHVFGENLAGRVRLGDGGGGGVAAPFTFADAAAAKANEPPQPTQLKAESATAARDGADGNDDAKNGDAASTSAASASSPAGAAAAASDSASASLDGGGEEKAEALKVSAERYQQEKQLGGREFSQVAVVTGEEGEENVLHMSCRVFLFDAGAKSWTERGRALLRLNDRRPSPGERGEQPLKSRLICRSQGGLKVIVNTLLWPAMVVESLGEKRLRLSVQSDDGGLRVCLLDLNSPGDAQQLNAALASRLRQLRSFAAAPPPAAPAAAKRRAAAPNDDKESSSAPDVDSSGEPMERKRSRPNEPTAEAAAGEKEEATETASDSDASSSGPDDD